VFFHFIFSSVTIAVHGQHDPQDKHPVLCLKQTDTTVLLCNGADAPTAVAVTLPIRNRHLILERHLTRIGISDFNQELILPDAAV
jgi:hypothetical protein